MARINVKAMPRMQGNYHYYSLYLLIYDLLDFLLICALSCFGITICAFGRFLESIPKQAFAYLIIKYIGILKSLESSCEKWIQTFKPFQWLFLEFCINCFGPLLDSVLFKAYLHSFGLKKAVPFFLYFDSTGKR